MVSQLSPACAFENQQLKQLPVVVERYAPFFVVVFNQEGVVRPAAPYPTVLRATIGRSYGALLSQQSDS